MASANTNDRAKCPYCNAQGQHTITYDGRIRHIQAWLSECLEIHPQCKWPEALPPLPTRVLELSLEDRTEDVRLVDGNGRHGHYAALTYCWGPNPKSIFKTESFNLQQNQLRIDFNDLNLLFRETITVLRSLAIPYLWIDALCIIQDSEADWKAEAARMAAVYSNAHLTISASMSTSPDTVLVPPSTFDTSGYEASSRTGNLHAGMVYTVTHGLSNRGWCLQERCLSRRIVHFGLHQMFWECPGCTDEEHVNWRKRKGRNELSAGNTLILGPTGFLEPPIAPVGAIGLDQVGSPYRRWYSIMNDYTQRSLTRESDRIPAMLGLIDVYMRGTGDRIIYGLCQGDLGYGLRWIRRNRARPDGPDAPGMPSWSWLRNTGRVRWSTGPVAFQVISFDEETMAITLRGKLFRFRPASRHDLDNGTQPVNGLEGRIMWNVDPISVGISMEKRHRMSFALGSDTKGSFRDLWVLVAEELSDSWPGMGLGLMLIRREASEAYQRVGQTSFKDCTFEVPINDLPLKTITIQ